LKTIISNRMIRGNTEPDGTSPVTVATKHSTLRVGGPVLNSKFLAIDDRGDRFAFWGWRMLLGQSNISDIEAMVGIRSDAMLREELSFTQHVSQELAETIFIDGCTQPSVTNMVPA
jgi:hypothetical protein